MGQQRVDVQVHKLGRRLVIPFERGPVRDEIGVHIGQTVVVAVLAH